MRSLIADNEVLKSIAAFRKSSERCRSPDFIHGSEVRIGSESRRPAMQNSRDICVSDECSERGARAASSRQARHEALAQPLVEIAGVDRRHHGVSGAADDRR
jgi:hypothetical protein